MLRSSQVDLPFKVGAFWKAKCQIKTRFLCPLYQQSWHVPCYAAQWLVANFSNHVTTSVKHEEDPWYIEDLFLWNNLQSAVLADTDMEANNLKKLQRWNIDSVINVEMFLQGVPELLFFWNISRNVQIIHWGVYSVYSDSSLLYFVCVSEQE